MPTNLEDASNSIKSSITMRCSLRLPPTLSAETAKDKLKSILLKDPPFNAKVELTFNAAVNGFDSGVLREDLKNAFFKANAEVFGGT